MSEERITVTISVDRDNLEAARTAIARKVKENDPSVTLPLSDEKVVGSLFWWGFDAFMEDHGEDNVPPLKNLN